MILLKRNKMKGDRRGKKNKRRKRRELAKNRDISRYSRLQGGSIMGLRLALIKRISFQQHL